MYPFHILSEDYDYGAILIAGVVCVWMEMLLGSVLLENTHSGN